MPPKSTPTSPPNGKVPEAGTGLESSIPPIVGINFGNAYASIAVFTKEGLAECIANEDGERQIACAISYHGEQVYIGNEAKNQLVKNAKNTIIGFRDLLGKKYSEVANTPLIAPHPSEPETPSWTVQVLVPAPSPAPTSKASTPASEPSPTTQILVPQSATTIFLSSLIKSASTFLGKPIEGAVITVPPHFTKVQREALTKAASDAGITILQLIDEAGAISAVTTTPLWVASNPGLPSDRTQLAVDLGASSLSLSLLSIRNGLSHIIAESTTASVSGYQLDEALLSFFSKEFTKKTKITLGDDKRAHTKLLLALEHTKRTLSASPNAATISIESLKDGMDFTSSINRMRFDMLARPVYTAVSKAVASLLASVSLDPSLVDEIVFVGGSTSLPGLSNHLLNALPFTEDVHTPFSSGLVTGGGIGDPTTVLARGAAIQAALVSSISATEEPELRAAFSTAVETRVLTKTVGLIFPGEDVGKLKVGGTYVPVLLKETAIPSRRKLEFEIAVPENAGKIAVEVWEVVEGVKINKVKPPPVESSDDEDEDEEEIEERTPTLDKTGLLGVVVLDAKLAAPVKGAKKAWSTKIAVTVTSHLDGKFDVVIKELGEGGATGGFAI